MGFCKMWSLVLCMATLGLAGCGGERPSSLGLTEGRLIPCPDSPNCVSSRAENSYHGMEPIPLEQPAEAAQDALLALLQEIEQMEVVSVAPGYIHAEASSGLFGFVDDVELVVNQTEGVIHFRSASRMGYGDMGANRKRMETIIAKYQEVVASPA